jgi:hypothetical protein
MPIVVFIQASLSWLASGVKLLTFDIENTLLEFILLGRIPATDLYLQFETLIAINIGLVFCVLSWVIFFKDPRPNLD